MSNKKIFLGIIALATIFTTSALAQAVWNNPTQTPPGDNVATPLNVSNIMQTKVGGLILNAGDATHDPATYGLLVPFGKVGIGINPTQTLDVNGNIKAVKAYVDQVCNKANPTQCLNFSDVANIVSGATSGVKINLFSVTPSPVVYGQTTTWSGTATGGTGANCITRYRAYVSGSTGDQWTSVSGCPSTLTLNSSVVTDYNQRSFYLSNNPYSSNTYSVIWEVQGVNQGVTSVVPLTVAAQGTPSVTLFTASPTTATSGVDTVAFSGSASQGTACITRHRLVSNVYGYSPGWISTGCTESATLSVSYLATIGIYSLFNLAGANSIIWEVQDSAGNISRQTVTVNVWPQGGPTIDSFTLSGGGNRGLVEVAAHATRGQYCITGYSVVPDPSQTPSNENPYDTLSASPTDCPQYVNIDANIGGYYDAFGPRDMTFIFSVSDSQGNVVSQNQTITIRQ